MPIRLSGLLFLLCLTSCIDPITLDTDGDPQNLVVEGFISNVSFNQRQEVYPDPQPFLVKLSRASRVSNERDEPVLQAAVKIIDDHGGIYVLTDNENTGEYRLPDPDFMALPGYAYKLVITTAEGKTYESGYESLPEGPPLDSVSRKFEERLVAEDVGGEKSFLYIDGVEVSALLPENTPSETRYYRYEVLPSWVYTAAVASENSPNRTCYITNANYFRKINVKTDKAGNIPFPLFFLEIEGNARLNEDFSALIVQYEYTKESYEFWEKLKTQQESAGGIFDPPPFKIHGNIVNVDDPAEEVFGLFSVTSESSIRWFINQYQQPFPYLYTNPCIPVPGVPFIPRPECTSCLDYASGSTFITNQKPEWWRNY